jgi:hypothetical protein
MFAHLFVIIGGRDKRWVKMIDNREGDLTVFSQNKLAGKKI